MVEDEADRIGKGAFHLVIDDPLKLQGILRIFPVVVPALLFEGAAVEQGVEHHVAVDIHNIEVFLQITGGKGIIGDVRAGHRVEEGHQPALVDLAEDVLDRVFFRAHQYRMLEDMGDAGGVGREWY